jgi:5-methylcytosine-specific restriction protein A
VAALMAARPLRPCATRGCPQLVSHGHCSAHAASLARVRFAQQAAQRGTTTERGYGASWRGTRLAVLQDEPLCRHCAAKGRAQLAVTVDHKVPKALGGGDERANLQPLCERCNTIKTIADLEAIRRAT